MAQHSPTVSPATPFTALSHQSSIFYWGLSPVLAWGEVTEVRGQWESIWSGAWRGQADPGHIPGRRGLWSRVQEAWPRSPGQALPYLMPITPRERLEGPISPLPLGLLVSDNTHIPNPRGSSLLLLTHRFCPMHLFPL